jgi:hypothetical protein
VQSKTIAAGQLKPQCEFVALDQNGFINRSFLDSDLVLSLLFSDETPADGQLGGTDDNRNVNPVSSSQIYANYEEVRFLIHN